MFKILTSKSTKSVCLFGEKYKGCSVFSPKNKSLDRSSKICVGKIEFSLILPLLYTIKLQQGEH
jgi:hypothetical protein